MFVDGPDKNSEDEEEGTEENELDKQMGDLEDQEADKLDEQLWGSDDEETDENEQVLMKK